MLQSCITGVPAWVAQSKLKLNPSKTEFLLIGLMYPLDCKRSCRQLERRWRRSRSGYDRSKYRNYRNLCNRLMTEAKSLYFSNFFLHFCGVGQ